MKVSSTSFLQPLQGCLSQSRSLSSPYFLWVRILRHGVLGHPYGRFFGFYNPEDREVDRSWFQTPLGRAGLRRSLQSSGHADALHWLSRQWERLQKLTLSDANTFALLLIKLT